MDSVVFNYHLMLVEKEAEKLKRMSPDEKKRYLDEQKKERERKRERLEEEKKRLEENLKDLRGRYDKIIECGDCGSTYACDRHGGGHLWSEYSERLISLPHRIEEIKRDLIYT